jgi:HK97 gp10 family phage protein
MMADTMHVQGLHAISRALKELPGHIRKNVLRGMVSAGAADVRVEAQLRAPVYTGSVSKGHPPAGTLKRSIYQKFIREESSDSRITFYVGVRRGKKYRNQGKKGNLSQDAFYWWCVENGTVNMPKQPFLRPAFETKKVQAVNTMAEYGKNRIPLEVDKLRGGG